VKYVTLSRIYLSVKISISWCFHCVTTMVHSYRVVHKKAYSSEVQIQFSLKYMLVFLKVQNPVPAFWVLRKLCPKFVNFCHKGNPNNTLAFYFPTAKLIYSYEKILECWLTKFHFNGLTLSAFFGNPSFQKKALSSEFFSLLRLRNIYLMFRKCVANLKTIFVQMQIFCTHLNLVFQQA